MYFDPRSVIIKIKIKSKIKNKTEGTCTATVSVSDDCGKSDDAFLLQLLLRLSQPLPYPTHRKAKISNFAS